MNESQKKEKAFKKLAGSAIQMSTYLEENKDMFNMMEQNAKEVLEKANESIKKVAAYLEENKDMFDMMDLKLYDIQTYRWKEMEKAFPLCYEEDKKDTSGQDTFWFFCNDNYNAFIEDLLENDNIDFKKMKNQVGRTSSFYLMDWINTKHCKIDVRATISELLCDYFNYNYLDMTVELEIIPYGDYTIFDSECIDELKEMAKFYDWFSEKIKDVKKVYDRIKNFKENQVAYYIEYLEMEEERLQTMIDEELVERSEKAAIVTKIKDKYDISNEDMNILKNNIDYYII